MANIHDHTGERPQPTGGGMRRVLNDGSESAAELREFMQGLRGKSPQEVLGDVANSSLVRSTGVAAVGFAVVLFGLSVLSHQWQAAFGESEPKAAVAKQADSNNVDSGVPSTDADGSPAPDVKSGGDDEASAAAARGGGDPLLDNLDIGETRDADPQKNPLENSLDNLLDGAN